MAQCARVSAAGRWRRGPSKRLAAGIGAALALCAAQARAQVDATVEVLSREVGAGMIESLTVDCGPGEVAIGGGAQVSDNAGMDLLGSSPRFGATELLNVADGPAGAPSGWRGAAANTSGAAGTLHVGVLCAPELAVSTVVTSVSVASGTFAGATAECPGGSVAIGGGLALNGSALRITETGPRLPETGALAVAPEGVHEAPDAWTAFVRNPGGGSPLVKVAALCASLADVATHVAARNTQANGGSAGGEVDCPPGATGLGGGIASLNPLELTVTSTAPRFAGVDAELVDQPDGTAPAPIGWDARGRNDSMSVLLVKRAAICVPEPGSVAGALAVAAGLAGVGRGRGGRRARGHVAG